MLSVIRIAVKWLVCLPCGYVVTTTGVTLAHHIQHQSEGCDDIKVVPGEGITQVIMTTANGIFFFFFRLVSHQDGLVRTHASKMLSQLYFSVVYFTGRPQPFRHMRRRVRWTLHFIGCSLEIPVGLPLFKLWRETLVWRVYCVGRRRIYRWLTLTHKGMGITGFNIILST